MPQTISRKGWSFNKPPEGVEIDPDSPFAKGLQGAYLLNSLRGDFYNKTSAKSIFTKDQLVKGSGYRFDAANSPYLRNTVDNGPSVSGTSWTFTIAVGAVQSNVTNNNCLVCNANAGGWSPNRQKFYLGINATSNPTAFANDDNNLYIGNGSQTVVAGKPFFLACSFVNTAVSNISFNFVVNNTLSTSGSYSGTPGAPGNEALHIGSRPQYDFNQSFGTAWANKTTGDIFYVYWWNYQMPTNLMLALNKEPYSMWRIPPKRRIRASGAAPPATGSLLEYPLMNGLRRGELVGGFKA